ncbi:hypothetical protein [Nannocystis punicea]|uniref:Uncharacterized protein n=1 Tax=Nannocystis punicea TaxID=2995304 RepID=A0ABY7H3Q0_9BACT|nr:hypothetical protein [Nannocystis poenicansa]WAS93906.1 hypothetical protein O0S08_47850 [Nannocystis poenicansa]
MVRLPLAAPVLAAFLAVLAACRQDGGGSTMVTGVTTAVTSVSTGTAESSTSSSASSGSEGASGSASEGESGSSTTSTTSTGEAASSSTSTTSTTATTGDETTTGETGSTTMPDPVEACLAEVDPGDECSECICTACLMLWDACHADPGCTAIQQCAQINGCYDLECQEPCETTVNLWGGTEGPSYGLWKPLTGCLKATCRPKCPW